MLCYQTIRKTPEGLEAVRGRLPTACGGLRSTMGTM